MRGNAEAGGGAGGPARDARAVAAADRQRPDDGGSCLDRKRYRGVGCRYRDGRRPGYGNAGSRGLSGDGGNGEKRFSDPAGSGHHGESVEQQGQDHQNDEGAAADVAAAPKADGADARTDEVSPGAGAEVGGRKSGAQDQYVNRPSKNRRRRKSGTG